MVAITGSRAIERFTGPQIRKFRKDDPAGYERTAEIHLVSSFVASLLTGTSVPIDLGDGAGMNLLDLARGAGARRCSTPPRPDLGPQAQTGRPQRDPRRHGRRLLREALRLRGGHAGDRLHRR